MTEDTSNYLDTVELFDSLEIRTRGIYYIEEYHGNKAVAPYIGINMTDRKGQRWRADALRDAIGARLPRYAEMAPEAAVMEFVAEYQAAYPHVRDARLLASSPTLATLVDRRVEEGVALELQESDGGGAPWDSDYKPPPGPSKPQLRGLEPLTEVQRGTLGGIVDPEKRAALYLCYFGGLRESEAVALKWGDVHPGRIYIRAGKTGDGSVAVHPDLARALNVLRTERGDVQPEDRVIPRCRQTVYRWCVSITGESPHALRHSCAMDWIEQHGYQDAADHLRHAHVGTTIGHYAKYHLGKMEEKVTEIRGV